MFRTSFLRVCVFLYSVLFVQSLSLSSAQTTTTGSLDVTGSGALFVAPYMEAITQAYLVKNPSMSIAMKYYVDPTEAVTRFLNKEFDMAATGTVPSKLQLAQNANVMSFPTGALANVAVYNIPGISGTQDLILDGVTLCRIYTGGITSWADSQIQILNPSLTLPNVTIFPVGINSAVAPMYSFSAYCNLTIGDEWTAAGIGVTQFPKMPSVRRLVGSYNAMVSTVIDTVGGITVVPNVAAQTMKGRVALMKNKAGAVVAPTSAAICTTVVELGVGDIYKSEVGYLLVNPQSLAAWPLASMTYVHIDKASNLSTCQAKKALLEFWYWLYSNSAVTSTIAESVYFAALPPTYIKSSLVVERMRESMTCQGKLLSDTQSVTATIQGMTTPFNTLRLAGNFYSQINNNYQYTFISADNDLTMKRLLTREADIAVIGQTLSNTHLATLTDTSTSNLGYALIIPTLLTAVVPIFSLPAAITRLYTNLTTTPSLVSNEVRSLPSLYPLVLDIETLAALYLSDINSWLDPRMTSLNPQLTAWFNITGASSAITKIICCSNIDDPSVASSLFLTRLNSTLHFKEKVNSVFLNGNTQSTTVLSDLSTALLKGKWTSLANYATTLYGSTYITVDNEVRLPVKTVLTPSSVSYKMLSAATNDMTTEFQLLAYKEKNDQTQYLSKVDSAVPSATGSGFAFDRTKLNIVAAKPSNLQPCLATSDAIKATYIPPQIMLESAYGSCYPMTSVLHLAVPTTYSSTSTASTSSSSGSSSVSSTTSTNSCERASYSLQFLSWFYSSAFLANNNRAAGFIRISDNTDVRDVVQDKLNHVLCDNDSILINFPVYYFGASASLRSASVAIFAVLQPVFVLSLALLYIYRQTPVIRSSSVHFLAVTLFGQILMIGSLLPLTENTSDQSCSSFIWLTNLGFTLAFAPLFAKTYRIYVIFSKRKLQVVKISNMKLALTVLCIVLGDLLVLTLWQVISPFKPVNHQETVNSRSHEIVSCSVDSQGMGFLAFEATTKFLLLLFGSLCSFAIRQVHSAFNESSQIAWCIYNTVFSSLIIAAIQAFVKPIEEVFLIIVLFLIVWINIGLYSFIFIPKFMAVFSSDKKNPNAVQATAPPTSGSNDGFSFLSLDGMTVHTLKLYIRALSNQMTVAKKKLIALLPNGAANISHAHTPTNGQHTDGGQHSDTHGVLTTNTPHPNFSHDVTTKNTNNPSTNFAKGGSSAKYRINGHPSITVTNANNNNLVRPFHITDSPQSPGIVSHATLGNQHQHNKGQGSTWIGDEPFTGNSNLYELSAQHTNLNGTQQENSVLFNHNRGNSIMNTLPGTVNPNLAVTADGMNTFSSAQSGNAAVNAPQKIALLSHNTLNYNAVTISSPSSANSAAHSTPNLRSPNHHIDDANRNANASPQSSMVSSTSGFTTTTKNVTGTPSRFQLGTKSALYSTNSPVVTSTQAPSTVSVTLTSFPVAGVTDSATPNVVGATATVTGPVATAPSPSPAATPSAVSQTEEARSTRHPILSEQEQASSPNSFRSTTTNETTNKEQLPLFSPNSE